jgi:hypothetical protein
MTTTALAPIATADLGDELTAGMAFPVRNALVPLSHGTAVAHIVALHTFWSAAAEGYARLVGLGCTDAEYDLERALGQVARYAPTGGAR